MSKLQKNFGAYTTQSVHDKLSILEKEASQLKAEIKEQNERIKELTKAIDNKKAEEETIGETIIDAKHLSSRIIREAQHKAEKMITDSEKNLKNQFEEYKNSFSNMEHSRHLLVGQKEQLYQELQEILNRYQKQTIKTEVNFGESWQTPELSINNLNDNEILAFLEKHLQNFNSNSTTEQTQDDKPIVVFPKLS